MPANLQIFISHASRDKGMIPHLELAMNQWGLHPWVDRQALAGGQRWTAELRAAVMNSAALVLVVTPAALASPMVREEYMAALSGAIPVVLLMLRPVPQLPAELAHAPRVAWTGGRWRGEQRLFVALYELGIRPYEDRTALGSRWSEPVLLVNAGHAPQDWKQFTVARPRYFALLAGYTLAALPIVSLMVAMPFVYNTRMVPTISAEASLAEVFLVAIMPIAALLVLFFALRMLLVPLVAFLAYSFAWWPAELVVITDTGLTTSLFRFRWARAAIVAAHFPFAAIARLSFRRSLFGRTTLIIEGNGQTIRATLPARLRRTRALATEIVEAWQSYAWQPAAYAQPASSSAPSAPPHTPVAPLPVHPSAASLAPRYVVIAGPEDRALLASINAELQWRGITQAECVELPRPESLILPAATGARVANIALVVLSARVVRSPRLDPILRDLTSLGVLVIPIVVAPRVPTPPVVASLQWVDFSAHSTFPRGVSDLLNALDVAGIPLTVPPGVVDGGLILARASHGRSLPDWHVFQPMSQILIVYRHLNRIRRLGSPRYLIAGRESAYKQLIDRRAIPEMVVVTPQAAVIHVVNARSSQFDDYVLPLDAIQRIERLRAYYTPIRLRVTFRGGQAVEFGLPGSLGDVDLVATTIEQQWHTAQARNLAPVAPSPRTA